MRSKRASVRAIAVVMAASALALLTAQGCATGSGDCSEKATCGDDGSTQDGTGPHADGTGGNDGTSSGGGDGNSTDGTSSDDATNDVTGDSTADASDSAIQDVAQPEADAATVCPQASTCVDPPTSGWSGPVALFDQSGTPPLAALPSCPASWAEAYDGNANPTSPAAVCTCSCGPATGATCSDVLVSVYDNSSSACWPGSPCGGGGFDATTDGCALVNCTTPTGIVASAPTVTGGSCSPQHTTSKPASQWQRTARACSTAPGTGCPGQSLCMPVPAFPYSGKLCVWRSGDVGCPSGMYSQKTLYYSGVTDTRNCTTCTCGSPTGTCDGATVSMCTAWACGGSCQTVNADGNCTLASAGAGYTGQLGTAPTLNLDYPNNCSHNTVTGTGSVVVDPSTATTVCCQL